MRSVNKRAGREGYKGRLLQHPMPESPGWPSRKGLDEWNRVRKKLENEGIQLLSQHYGIGQSALQSEEEKLRELILALARDHVPFFKIKKNKSPTWDSFALARLLFVYENWRKDGYDSSAARDAAVRGLPKKLRRADNNKTIRNRLADARRIFRPFVRVTQDHSIEPVDESGARAWKVLLSRPDPASDDENVTFEPSPEDPDGVLVSGLRVPK